MPETLSMTSAEAPGLCVVEIQPEGWKFDNDGGAASAEVHMRRPAFSWVDTRSRLPSRSMSPNRLLKNAPLTGRLVFDALQLPGPLLAHAIRPRPSRAARMSN